MLLVLLCWSISVATAGPVSLHGGSGIIGGESYYHNYRTYDHLPGHDNAVSDIGLILPGEVANKLFSQLPEEVLTTALVVFELCPDQFLASGLAEELATFVANIWEEKEEEEESLVHLFESLPFHLRWQTEDALEECWAGLGEEKEVEAMVAAVAMISVARNGVQLVPKDVAADLTSLASHVAQECPSVTLDEMTDAISAVASSRHVAGGIRRLMEDGDPPSIRAIVSFFTSHGGDAVNGLVQTLWKCYQQYQGSSDSSEDFDGSSSSSSSSKEVIGMKRKSVLLIDLKERERLREQHKDLLAHVEGVLRGCSNLTEVIITDIIDIIVAVPEVIETLEDLFTGHITLLNITNTLLEHAEEHVEHFLDALNECITGGLIGELVPVLNICPALTKEIIQEVIDIVLAIPEIFHTLYELIVGEIRIEDVIKALADHGKEEVHDILISLKGCGLIGNVLSILRSCPTVTENTANDVVDLILEIPKILDALLELVTGELTLQDIINVLSDHHEGERTRTMLTALNECREVDDVESSELEEENGEDVETDGGDDEDVGATDGQCQCPENASSDNNGGTEEEEDDEHKDELIEQILILLRDCPTLTQEVTQEIMNVVLTVSEIVESLLNLDVAELTLYDVLEALATHAGDQADHLLTALSECLYEENNRRPSTRRRAEINLLEAAVSVRSVCPAITLSFLASDLDRMRLFSLSWQRSSLTELDRIVLDVFSLPVRMLEDLIRFLQKHELSRTAGLVRALGACRRHHLSREKGGNDRTFVPLEVVDRKDFDGGDENRIVLGTLEDIAARGELHKKKEEMGRKEKEMEEEDVDNVEKQEQEEVKEKTNQFEATTKAVQPEKVQSNITLSLKIAADGRQEKDEN